MKRFWLPGLAVLIIILSGCGGGGDGTPGDPSGNHAPTAYAGDDRTVAVGATVTLDGSDCTDSDGDTLTYQWQFAGQPDDSTAALSDDTAISPTFSADAAGQYIVELTVSDGTATASDSVLITASAGGTSSDCDQIVPGANPADDFVCAHNAVRENPQPAPTPALQEMTWDPALAQIARNYAEKCIWKHNDHRSDTYPGYVGENLYISTWPNSTPGDAVNSWAEEDQYYDYDSNTCQSGQMCGHYTQIVWRDAIKVGCASVLCPSVSEINWTNATIVVCNYAPGGNWGGEKPY